MKQLLSLIFCLLASISMYGQISGQENGREWVDLGLSVKWATCNIGANSPSGKGGFYAWGETSTKSTYLWETLKYCIDANGNDFLKYSFSDNKTRLELSDDASRTNWGGRWRTPTKKEYEELISQCTFSWTTYDGVEGYIVKSKINGNAIFFPALGRMTNKVNTALDFGYYWSSESEAGFAGWGLEFSSPEEATKYRPAFSVRYSERCNGYQIRPVL